MSLAVCGGCSARYAPSLDRCPQCRSTERGQDITSGPLLPFVDVACTGGDCPAAGVVRRVYLRQAAPGVLELSRLLCGRCGGEVQVVRSWRDEPTGTGSVEETGMAKITVHTGASNERDEDQVDQPEAVVTEDASEAPAEAEETDYQAWTVEELRAELGRRDLPTTGKKADLSARLAEADQQPADEE